MKPLIICSKREMFKRNCEHCNTETLQTVELYNPDNPDEGEVWQCSVCKENTDVRNIVISIEQDCIKKGYTK